MQMRFFTIPIRGGDMAAEELNRFLGMHRILAVDRTFAQDGANSAWAVCVSFETAGGRPQSGKRDRIDYREVFNDQEFAIFSRLRTLRKELAEKEGLPVYAVLNNDQLAEMVRQEVQTVEALREISGIGEARVKKYGERFLRLLREAFAEFATDPSETSHET